MKKSKPSPPCEHHVALKYWYDQKAEAWTAELTFTEKRQGRQYGGAVVSRMVAETGTDYKAFMGMVRQKAIESIRTFWT